MNQFIDLVNNIKNPFQISASQETLKTNKVSGFRKMGLTDDEILAQDNSLEEYL